MSLGLNLHSCKRRELDFYPTPHQCTHALMLFLKNNINMDLKSMEVWEPACGENHMSRVISQYVKSVTGTDIKDGVNYLTAKRLYNYDAIITNPPFKDSEGFIRKAIKEAPLVAMLLKSQYWHAASRYTLFKEHTPAYVLPLTWRPDFDGRGKPTMEVAWTLWIEGCTECCYLPLEKPKFKRKNLF